MEDFGHALCADLPRVPCISVVGAFSFRKGAGWYIVDPGGFVFECSIINACLFHEPSMICTYHGVECEQGSVTRIKYIQASSVCLMLVS